MTTFAVAGFQGRMGQAVCEEIWNSDGTVALGAITHHSPLSWDVEGLEPTTAEKLDDCFDVLIDFTSPESMLAHLDACVRLKKPMVIGTTGYSVEEKGAVENAAQQIPIFMASNMSIGVNILIQLAQKAAAWLPEYDAEILELHHRHKKDAPSGTALSLGEAIAKGKGVSLSDHMQVGRSGMSAGRPESEIGIAVMRGGSVAGEHSAVFLGDRDRLTITHEAFSRDIFAQGAVKAGLWLKSQPVGLYGMMDLINLS